MKHDEAGMWGSTVGSPAGCREYGLKGTCRRKEGTGSHKSAEPRVDLPRPEPPAEHPGAAAACANGAPLDKPSTTSRDLSRRRKWARSEVVEDLQDRSREETSFWQDPFLDAP